MHVSDRTQMGLKCYSTWNFWHRWGCDRYGLPIAAGIFSELQRKATSLSLSANNFPGINRRDFLDPICQLGPDRMTVAKHLKKSLFSTTEECAFTCWCAAFNTSQFPNLAKRSTSKYLYFKFGGWRKEKICVIILVGSLGVVQIFKFYMCDEGNADDSVLPETLGSSK